MSEAELFGQIARLAESGHSYVIATVVDTAGSAPQKSGARMVVVDDGQMLGTIGGGAIEKQILDACQEVLASGQNRLIETHLTRDLGMCCGGAMKVFLERHEAPARLTLFGAGHVNREVCALASRCGFGVTVVDEREEWLTEERFPRAVRMAEDPAVAARRLELGPADLVCVATHDHALDEQVLRALKDRPLRYVGMIGSERKAIRFRERLQAAGLTPQDVDRVQTPMGVAIGAQTPEEIAVSVVAELIRVRRSGGPSP